MALWVAVQFKVKKELDIHKKVYEALQVALAIPPENFAAQTSFIGGLRRYNTSNFDLLISEDRQEVESVAGRGMYVTAFEAVDGWSDDAIETAARDTYQALKEAHKSNAPKRKKAKVHEAPLFDFLPESISQPENLPQQEMILYTVGHSNLLLKDFVHILQKNRIGLLIDVRSQPYSRYSPHFNREALKPGLEQLQISYRFAGEYLGGRPTDPLVYKNHQLPAKGVERLEFLELVDYLKVMEQPWYRKGIQALIYYMNETFQKEQYVAIMCSEGHPHECHRHHLITRSLVDPQLKIDHNIEVQVRHIFKDGLYKVVTANEFEAAHEHQQATLF